MFMEIKRTLSKIVYRIEPKPEGGFIARASDPEVPALEAPTREELQQKIQAAVSATLASQFPGLKLPLENKELKYSFHIEAKPGGGFVAHSSDPSQAPIEGVTHEEVQHHLAERLAGALGSYFLPELSQALGTQVNAGDVKVFVNRKVSFTANAGSHKLTIGGAPDPQGAMIQAQDVKNESGGDLLSNSPIVPVEGMNWRLFRFLLVVAVLAAVMYFFLRFR
jgi:hypothetical protein